MSFLITMTKNNIVVVMSAASEQSLTRQKIFTSDHILHPQLQLYLE